MKILLLRKSAVAGGTETRYMHMQREFARRGLEAGLFWFREGPLLSQVGTDQNSTVGNLADAVERVADGGYEVIQCHGGDFVVGAAALAGLGGARLFPNIAGDLLWYWPAGRCTALIAVSRWLRNGQRRCTNAQVVLVYNGVDTERYCPGQPSELPPRPVVAWVGTASKLSQKRIDRLAAAAPGLVAQGFDLWVASHDPASKLPPALSAALEPLVARWEAFPADAMPELYRAVAASGGCVLSTCDWEGHSNAMLEAQSCGCPMICTDAPGANEAVRPEHGGELYPPALDGPALAERVGEVLRDPRGTAWRGAAAREMVVEQFSLDRMIQGHLAVYERRSWPRRWDPYALARPLKDWTYLRRPDSRLRRSADRAAVVCYEAARELEARGRRDLAAHVRERARALAPWRRGLTDAGSHTAISGAEA